MLNGVDGFNLECGVPVVVFNIGGNKFRLVARIYYDFGRVYVKTVLTHKEYDDANWKEQICLGLI
jgi:mRNA-degrading endonuclease HigB of HigAB toxin-antitoxin module